MPSLSFGFLQGFSFWYTGHLCWHYQQASWSEARLNITPRHPNTAYRGSAVCQEAGGSTHLPGQLWVCLMCLNTTPRRDTWTSSKQRLARLTGLGRPSRWELSWPGSDRLCAAASCLVKTHCLWYPFTGEQQQVTCATLLSTTSVILKATCTHAQLNPIAPERLARTSFQHQSQKKDVKYQRLPLTLSPCTSTPLSFIAVSYSPTAVRTWYHYIHFTERQVFV